MSNFPVIVRFQYDLRLDDHPALTAAVETGRPVIPLFVITDRDEADWGLGSASRWWLHFSLQTLDEQLRKIGSRLILRSGDPQKAITALIEETKASGVYASRSYEPATRREETKLAACLEEMEVDFHNFSGHLLYEPEEIETQQRGPYRVFTPFWKSCLATKQPEPPLDPPDKLKAPKKWPKSEKLDSWELLPKIDWDSGLCETWTPGCVAAGERLQAFLDGPAGKYQEGREYPAQEGTSRLSPHLRFGEISPRRVWGEIHTQCGDAIEVGDDDLECFLSEIGWREFAHHVLWHFPQTADEPLREKFQEFPWKKDAAALRAWQRGRTGYPIVDAGMRELWATGWMHNRARMIVASFLTKDLLLSWREGAKWFWDTLVDADLANNTLGWQWASGCGADAAPYFRIFNPVSQGEKFDADGDYVRRWVPELENLPNRWIHQPWSAPPEVLEEAGVELGETYPEPIVDHKQARKAALEAFEVVKG